MPVTVYQRLVEFYANNDVTPLSLMDKPFLGRRVAKAWREAEDSRKTLLPWVDSDEDTGRFKVLAYPDHFAPHIDRIIHEWYFPPEKKERSKRPAKPIYTAKPTGRDNG